MRIRNLFKWRKPYILDKSGLDEIKQGVVEEMRKQIAALQRPEPLTTNYALFNPTTPDGAGLDKAVYLYDFLGEWGSNALNVVGGTGIVIGGTAIDVPADENSPVGPISIGGQVIGEAKRIKPIDVLNELETFAGPDMLDGIDAKIAVMKAKIDLIRNNSYAEKEVIDMVTRLENRKKWEEFKEFYSQFNNTTSDKVQTLVNKYELVLKGSDLFIGNMPDEAINIMKEYVDQTVNLCGKRPVFYVIAEQQEFKDQYKKKDPILLVQSPFGAYWQILGAWDKEMILLEEL